jgi:hypothetical protein
MQLCSLSSGITGDGIAQRATGLIIGGSSPGRGWKFFSLPPSPDRLWGPPRLPSMGTRDSFPGVKRPRHEADYSPPFSAEVKKEWSYTSVLPVHLHGVVLS